MYKNTASLWRCEAAENVPPVSFQASLLVKTCSKMRALSTRWSAVVVFFLSFLVVHSFLHHRLCFCRSSCCEGPLAPPKNRRVKKRKKLGLWASAEIKGAFGFVEGLFKVECFGLAWFVSKLLKTPSLIICTVA